MSLISKNDYIRRVYLVSELRTMFEVQLTTTFVLSHHHRWSIYVYQGDRPLDGNIRGVLLQGHKYPKNMHDSEKRDHIRQYFV